MIDIRINNYMRFQKILPTLDFGNPFNLKGWTLLRQSLLNYGEPFKIRFQKFTKNLILLNSFLLIQFTIWFFDIVQFTDVQKLISLLEMIFAQVLILLILFKGALLHEVFLEQRVKLEDIRQLINTIYRMRESYFTNHQPSSNYLTNKIIGMIALNLRRSLSNPALV